MKSTAFSIKKAVPLCKRHDRPSRAQSRVLAAWALVLLSTAPLRVWGDQVEMQNGDRYVGQVLSLDTKTVVLQSGVLGTVRVPRSKVAVITLGPTQGTNSPAVPLPTDGQFPLPLAAAASSGTNAAPALRGLGANTNLIQQVQKQFLGGAGTEASTKFNELLGGLMNGSLNVDDIRTQAKTAADQLRALQKDSGEDTGFATSTYLAILDHFLKETAPSGSATNAPARSPGSTPTPAEKED